MGFYNKYVLPRFLNAACGTKPIIKQREKVVPACTGRVLEVGMGSGLNLSFYDPDKVDMVFGLEPAPEMVARATISGNIEAASCLARESASDFGYPFYMPF